MNRTEERKYEPTESHLGAPEVACPVCGVRNTDLYEQGGPFELENESVEIECGDCGHPLLLSCRVLVTYILSARENAR